MKDTTKGNCTMIEQVLFITNMEKHHTSALKELLYASKVRLELLYDARPGGLRNCIERSAYWLGRNFVGIKSLNVLIDGPAAGKMEATLNVTRQVHTN
jgi:hypothetical protein